MSKKIEKDTKESGLRCSTLRSSVIDSATVRLDAKYYQQEFIRALAMVERCGISSKSLSDIAKAFVPDRAKLITMPASDVGAPYLKAHDAFKALPDSDRYVAAKRMKGYEDYLLREGMILTPSSGRNLGPTAYVGKSLEKFAMTDIMRIVPVDRVTGFYLLAFLRTFVGQALIRRGRTGTNIDHLAPDEVLNIPVVWPDDGLRLSIARDMKKSQDLLETARAAIEASMGEIRERTGLGHAANPMAFSQFVAMRSEITSRLDAAFYSSEVTKCRKAVAAKQASSLCDVAELRLLGRYKRYYVEQGHGRPILSGTHLLQLRPVNLKHISDRSFTNPEAFVLQRGWTLLTCDGRAEEGLGSPAYVSSLWDGWMASNHVMRVMPMPEMPEGYLYAALCLSEVQAQIKAAATGSVVDAIEPESIGNVLVPRLPKKIELALSERIVFAWESIAESRRLEDSTVRKLDALIAAGYDGRRLRAA